MHCKSIDKSQEINFGIYKPVPLFGGDCGPKSLMEISLDISKMEYSVGKIKDNRVLESTKPFYYIDGVKES